MTSSYQGVALTCPVSFGYSKHSDKSARWYIGSVLREMLKQSGLKKSAVDGLAVSSFSLEPDSASFLTQHYDMSVRWIEQLPYGGASGILALRRAARAIQCGDADVIACIGGDTANPDSFKDLTSNFSSFSNSAAYPYGSAGPNMPFALITAAYMHKYGASREDFGQLAVAQRYNAQHFDGALLGHKPLSMDDYLNARPIAEPLHLFDCVMPCAGGEGFMVMSTERANALDLAYVEIASAEERHNAFVDDDIQLRAGWAQYRDDLYNSADVGPDAMDLMQSYDDYPVICALQLEGLGLCKEGEFSQFVKHTNLRFDGDLPHNTSGGQLSVGQAGSAAGYLGVVESIRQLTQCAKRNQVNDPTHALVSGYGMINYDRGLCSAASILRKPL